MRRLLGVGAVALNLSTGPVINAGGGLLLLVLAALVLSVRPVRGRNLFLAAFCAGLGVWTIVFYLLGRDDPLMPFAAPVAGAAMLVCSVGLAGLAMVAPRRLAGDERRLLVLPALAATAGLAVTTWGMTVGLTAWLRATHVPESARTWEALLVGSYCIFASTVAGVLVFLALRSRTAADAHERSQYGSMAAAIVVYMGLVSGIFFVTPLVFTLSIAIAIALGVGCSAVVWLTNSRRPGERRQARDLALFSLSMVLLGMVAGAWLGGFSGAKGAGLFGVARSAAILVLAYAILKHQLLGIDVKIRFAIKTSTVAAVFLAVLFIVANIAQNYLGGKFGVVVGGAAAGMLFFVMAPIQRVAERFAEKAVPVTGASTAAPARPNDGEDAYRRAVRLALRAGISREEAHDLAVLADQLHIGAKRALEIREDLERRAPT